MKYEEFLTQELLPISGLFSNELAERLNKKFGVTAENARKIIERAVSKNVIWSSKPLSFGKGRYYYFLPNNRPSREMIKLLAKDTRPPLYRLLQLLDESDGVITIHEALKVTSSPEEKSSSKVSLLKDMVNDLAKSMLVVEKTSVSGIKFILNRKELADNTLSQAFYEQAMNSHWDKLQLDTLFIPDLLRWLKSCNIISSWGQYKSRNNPSIGVKQYDLNWDAYAFTKTTGINPGNASESTEPEKQTMAAMDIVISRKYTMTDLNGFLSRIQITLNAVKKSTRKVLPIILFHEIEDKALFTAQKLGFITFSLSKIYGSNITKLIGNIKRIYSADEESLTFEIEGALKRIAENGQLELLKAMRGTLFEILMKPVIQHLYPASMFLPAKVLKHPNRDQTREFDHIVSSSHPKELILVELKGYAGNNYINLGDQDTPGTLKYFFRSSVPLATEYYKNDSLLQQHNIKAIFITTGEYHSECNETIKALQNSTLKPSKINSCVMNGKRLLELLKSYDFDNEIKLIKKYYIDVNEDGDAPEGPESHITDVAITRQNISNIVETDFT